MLPRDLELAATVKFQQLRQQTQVQFKEIMSDQKVIQLNIDIAAPNIIIPQNPAEVNSPLLILDLGRLVIKSDIDSAKKAIENAKNGDDSINESDLFLYRQILIDVTQIHAFLSTVKEFNMSMLENTPEGARIIDKFDVSVNLGICRAHSDKLALLKLRATLPELKGYVNSKKLSDILLIVDAVTATDPADQTNPSDVTMDKLLAQVAEVSSPSLFFFYFVV